MGFQNKNTQWTEVSSANSSTMLPAGGYVATITDVEDVESKEYLRFTYDIAEGEHKGFFEADDRVYVHQFVRSYKDSAAGFMKQFLECIEDSNAKFKLDGWDNNINDLKGKLIGIIVQREDYTNKSGEDRARMNVEGFAKADDIRNNRFKLPEPKDSRKSKTDSDNAGKSSDTPVQPYDDADVPF